MKTTKDIAELFAQEIERLSKGEVRKDVITGLEKCCNSLIKLARLEMDFAWKNWENQKPNVPWLSTQCAEPSNGDSEIEEPKQSSRAQTLVKEITSLQNQMKTANDTMQLILRDKIKTLQGKLAVALSQSK